MKRKYTKMDVRYWLDCREIASLPDDEYAKSVREYMEENTMYEDAHADWVRERRILSPLVFARDENVCVYCGSTENLQVDHIYPVTRGGSNDLSNLQILCRTCNIKKGNKV